MIGLVRSAWNVPRAAPPPPRRVWRDWLLAVGTAALAIAEGILRTDVAQPVAAVIALLAVTPTVLWRRTHPFAALVIVMIPVDILLPGSSLFASLFVLVIVYALFRWASGREILLGSVVVLASLALTFTRGGGLTELVGGFALLLTAVLLGFAFRSRAAARERLLDGIRVSEREQLARDLHDTVAHHVSAIAIHAQAGLVVAEGDPHAAADALRVIETEAGRTLGELRSMVRVLRHHDAGELAPSPGLESITDLAGPHPGGAMVTVAVTGDDGSIPPPVAAAVFRLAQESVTNALRHARRVTHIDVRVTVDDQGVHLDVSDDGDAAPPPTPGFGIIGMRERAALLGGTCDAGPASGGGWRVSAALPRAGWAP